MLFQAWRSSESELYFFKQPPSPAPQVVYQWQAGAIQIQRKDKDEHNENEERQILSQRQKKGKTVPFLSSGIHCNSFPPQADPHTLRHYPIIQHENGLQTAILGLDFQVLVIVHVIVLIMSWSI